MDATHNPDWSTYNADALRETEYPMLQGIDTSLHVELITY